VSAFLWVGPIAVVVTLVMSLMAGANQRKWRFCFWLAFFALLGYSVHMYIPIRSALQPMIDENHPATWEAFKHFLERKQYGSDNMFLRMLHRRGALTTQFGVDGHMGFGGFHLTQFFKFSALDTERSIFAEGAGVGFARLVIYLIPTFFMIYGWVYLYQKNRMVALLLIVLAVAMSVGLVLFMNFADGTCAERRDYLMWLRSGKRGQMPTVHREVRVRDYFFTSGFMFYSMWIGLSSSCLLHSLFTNRNSLIRTSIAPIVVILLAVSPALPLTRNFAENSRRGDWIPYDYAYNLLMSCEKEGLVFTNGDNDTFPLWFLQEAEGIRRDVRVVNLSLLNTTWYIKQLKDLEPKVPISKSHEEIDQLTHERNPFVQDARVALRQAGISVVVPGREKKVALRVQDKMVLNIVDSNKWRKPIYFAVTVSNDNKMGLDPYLQMQGLVYEINPTIVPASERINIDKTVYMLDNVYRFRGLGDGSTYLNETTRTLLSNYAAGFIQVALSLQDSLGRMKAELDRAAKPDSAAADSVPAVADVEQLRKQYVETLDLAIGKLDQCVALMPWDWRPRALRHRVLISHDRAEEAERRMREALLIEPSNNDYKKMLVQTFEQSGRKQEAIGILKELIATDEDPWYACVTLAKIYEEMGAIDSAIGAMQLFLESHPGDRRASSLIGHYQSMKRGPEPPLFPLGGDTGAASTVGAGANTKG
jgi:tetratricopeptide (TPR) repeat protein